MKVLILGLGQYPKGSGIAAALFFARRGDDVTVTDMKDAKALAGNVRRLKTFKNIRYVLGRHELEDVRRADLVVRNPRVRADSPEMREAKRLKIPVVSDISIFLERCPAQVIGVTGTRGKSTTSALIAEMLRADGRRVWLGGNILVSPLTFLSRVKPGDWVVLELSSWQLEATGAVGVSPKVAVWTNLMRDHLNTYRSMREYAAAKARIFAHQKSGGIAFLPADRAFDGYAKRAPGDVYRFGKPGSPEAKLVGSTNMRLVGGHNLRNAEIATAVSLHAGVSRVAIKRVLRSFGGLPGRLELVATKRGVRFVNDTTATTPDATMAALAAIAQEDGGSSRTIYLIFGGADKKLRFDDVARAMKRHRTHVILLPGTAQENIAAAFRKINLRHDDAKNMKEAFQLAIGNAKRGDTVLLSPGCASFGLFKNEYHRGDAFKKLVLTIPD